jgi:two-component sensor histidine kinase
MNMVCYPGDAAPDLYCHDLNDPWTALATGPQEVLAGAGEPAVRSRFESMAQRAFKVPPESRDLLGLLLASTSPVQDRGCRVLRPLWAEEAMHRAYSFVRLIDTRNRRGESAGDDTIIAQVEDAVARDLAVCFRDLTTAGERDVLSCSSALRHVMTGLGTLFGDPANITFETKIEEIRLPAYKRRALVLAASELVSNALLHGFRGRATGQIEVSLAALGPESACLLVADNGTGFRDSLPNLNCGVGAGLAGLLEADLAYDRVAGWTIAEIEFPVVGS